MSCVTDWSLRRRDDELEYILHTDDHIHFLQNFHSLCSSWIYRLTQHHRLLSYDECVSHLRADLENFCRDEIKKISNRVPSINIAKHQVRQEFLQYFRQFTLDLNTAHTCLCLSKWNRVITYTYRAQPYPDHLDRFDFNYQVLCSESVSGRCYWEVEWSGNVRISVSYKSISRKGWGNECVFGCNDQSWSLWCSESSCSFFHNNIETKLPVVLKSSRIGVYVDHSAGSLSFYSVSDTMTLIHRVNTTFTKPLYPGFRLFNILGKSKVKLI
nr:stonustoxin subunit beta-like [Misgurnus anguillicaudatus]